MLEIVRSRDIAASPSATARAADWSRIRRITIATAAGLGELAGAALVIYAMVLALTGSPALTTVECCGGGGALLMLAIGAATGLASLVKSS